MNYSRLALAAVGAFVAYFVLGGLAFTLAPQLRNQFSKYPAVYRSQEGIKSVMPAGMAAMFVAMVVLAVIYAMLYHGGSGVVEGARFGALIGVFAIGAFVVHNYVNLNIGLRLTVEQAAAYFRGMDCRRHGDRPHLPATLTNAARAGTLRSRSRQCCICRYAGWRPLRLSVNTVDLLDRDLTAEEHTVHALIRNALTRTRPAGAAQTTVREVASAAPERFFVAAMSMLEAERDAASRQSLFARFVECPEFLVQLTRTDRFTRDQLLETCRVLMKMDRLLDVRLARLAPGPTGVAGGLDAGAMVRVLDVLNEISDGPRLLLILNQLTHHPDPGIASKAVMLMARRVGNNQWVKRRLDSADARLRANVVEGLWGVDNAEARNTLWASLKDESNRVVGNALVGLHLLGEPAVGDLARTMLADERPPFRWTAAWVMGKLGQDEFVELLQRSLADGEQGVRQAARRALIAIRQAAITRQLEASARARKQEAMAGPALPADPAPSAEAAVAEAPRTFDIHLDGAYITSGVRAERSRRRLWPF